MPTQMLARMVPASAVSGSISQWRGSVDQAQLAQRVVDDPEVAIEHPAEDAAADHGRQHPAEEEEGADGAVAGEGSVEEQREREAERELEEQRAGGKDQGDPDRVPEGWVVDHRPVVVEADEGRVAGEERPDVDVLQAHPDVVGNRVEHRRGDVGHGREEKQVIAGLPPAHRAAARCGADSCRRSEGRLGALAIVGSPYSPIGRMGHEPMTTAAAAA